MKTIVECSHCGQSNHVDSENLTIAICGSCKESLVDERIPEGISIDEIEAAITTAPTTVKSGDVDVLKWTSKIGDQEKQTEYVNEGFFKKMKKYASKVPFTKDAVAMYYCAMDSATPLTSKATAIGALAYWILPIDLIPDFIPVAGFVDDATAILIAYKAISSKITDQHLKKAKEFLTN